MRSEGCSETPGGVQSLKLKKRKKMDPPVYHKSKCCTETKMVT